MDMSIRKITSFLLVAVLFYSGFSTSAFARSGGITGYSGQTAGMDCSNCHDDVNAVFKPTPMLNGPMTVDAGSTNSYVLNVDLAEFVAGGVDIAAQAGTLVDTNANGAQIDIDTGELTHTTPQLANINQENVWTFDWIAPTAPGIYTIYVGVAGVDNSSNTQGDRSEVTAMTVTVVGGNQAPVAMIKAPVTGTEDVNVTFDGTGSNDPDGNIIDYAWDFGDGNTGAGATVAHAFKQGNYEVTLTVTDDQGATATDKHNIQIDPAAVPKPPVASAGGPYRSIVNEVVTFDGSVSTDEDGTIGSYAWDFGDGNVGTGVSPTHTYTTAGVYTVTLTVTDNDNLTDDDSTTATIIALAPPVADAGGPYNGTVGVPLQFNGSASMDPDGTIVSYTWDFGDGTAPVDGASPMHAYSAAGTYTATLTVTDNDNQTDSDTATATIVVVPPPPVAPVAEAGNPYTGTTAAAVQFDGSGSSDADGQIVSYVWDFGDGNMGTGVSPMHTYAAPGEYTATLTVTDDDGMTGTDTAPVSIGAVVPPAPQPAPPTADSGNPYAGVVGTPIQFDGSKSSDSDGTIVAYDWDFGDGNTGTGPTPTHAYTVAGTYTGTLTVTDNDGLKDSANLTVNVAEPPPPTEPPPAPTEPPPPEDNLNGGELFGKYCAACHGSDGLGGSSEENVVGAYPAEIMEAIDDDEGGMGALKELLDGKQIEAISDWLRRGLPKPKDEKDLKKRGKKLYKAYCESCHGKKGAGGENKKSILGEDAEDIMEAHGPDEEADTMAFLEGMIDQYDIAALVVYLDYEEDKSDYKSEKEKKKQGKKDYKSYCQGCHGKKGKGGINDYPPVIGKDAGSIASALEKYDEMKNLAPAFLTTPDTRRIDALAVYLKYEYDKYSDKDDDDDDDDDDDKDDDD